MVVDTSNNIGLRQNNPGNLKDPATGAFRTFSTPDEGYQALLGDLKLKQSGGSSVIKPGASLADFAKVWAPASDNNNPDNYANTLATNLGVDTSHPFDQVPAEKLADAIKVAEGTSTSATTTKLSVADFASKIRAKYNAYENVDDQTLAQKFITKYPVYADKVDMGSGFQPTKTSEETPAPQSFGDKFADFMTTITGTKGAGEDIGGAIAAPENIQKYSDVMQGWTTQADILQQKIKEKQASGGDAQYLIDALKNHIATMPKESDFIPGAVDKTPEQIFGDFGQLGLGLVSGGAPGELAGTADVVDRIIQGGKVGAAFGGASGGFGAMQDNKSAGEIATESLKGGLIGGGIGAATGGVIEGLSAAYNKIAGAGAKTAAEILATAPENVEKLNPREQKLWYSAASSKAADLAKQTGEQATEAVTNEIQDFKQKIGSASRDETIALKPKAQQLMKDAGQEYLSLTGEAADGSPALGKTMTHDSLAAKIDSKFEYNPEVAASLKQDLGLETTKLGEEVPKITNQEILDKARGIMQEVSKSARGGNKVYSAAEYDAMQKYSFLMETLGDNGVDMKAANKFWKEWVPVRNRIVREVKPFDEANVEKMPFSSTLQKASTEAKTPLQAASKLDAQNFLNEIETRMKFPKGTLGSDTRTLVEGLEKAKLSKDNIAEVTKEALSQIKEARKNKSFDLQTAAQKTKFIKGIIKRVVVGVIGAGVGNLVGGKTGAIIGGVAGEALMPH